MRFTISFSTFSNSFGSIPSQFKYFSASAPFWIRRCVLALRSRCLSRAMMACSRAFISEIFLRICSNRCCSFSVMVNIPLSLSHALPHTLLQIYADLSRRVRFPRTGIFARWFWRTNPRQNTPYLCGFPQIYGGAKIPKGALMSCKQLVRSLREVSRCATPLELNKEYAHTR